MSFDVNWEQMNRDLYYLMLHVNGIYRRFDVCGHWELMKRDLQFTMLDANGI